MTRMFWFFMMGNESGVGFCMKTDLIFFHVSYFHEFSWQFNYLPFCLDCSG